MAGKRNRAGVKHGARRKETVAAGFIRYEGGSGAERDPWPPERSCGCDTGRDDEAPAADG
jgi:hypothetical protein